MFFNFLAGSIEQLRHDFFARVTVRSHVRLNRHRRILEGGLAYRDLLHREIARHVVAAGLWNLERPVGPVRLRHGGPPASVGCIAGVAQRARLHISMCDRRLQQATVNLGTADEYYNYGVAMINARKLVEARSALEYSRAGNVK